eukprot:173873-Ditylum_brightwellii.AAC.1
MVRYMTLVKRFSDDIGMAFGMEKCAILTIVNDKPVETTILDNFPCLPHGEGYAYLDILESLDFHTIQVKNNTTKEDISWLSKILKAQLSAYSIMTAICAYAVPVIHYSLGVVKWNEDVNHLYLHCSQGGRGLTGLWDTYAHECSVLVQYIQESDDTLISTMLITSTPITNHLNHFIQGQLSHTLQQKNDQHLAELQKKQLHGQLFVQQQEILQVGMEQCTKWMVRVGLNGRMEAALCAAMEQTLAINAITLLTFVQIVATGR